MSLQLHPELSQLALVCSSCEPAALLELGSGERRPLPCGGDAAAAPASGRKGAATPASVAVFNQQGDAAFVGGAAGTLVAVSTASLTVLSSTPLTAAPRTLSFCTRGDLLLAACADRVLRLVDVRNPCSPSVLRELHDTLDRTAPWRAAAISGCGSLVAAAGDGSGEHVVHVWSTADEAPTAVLEGPPDADGVLALAWHPESGVLATLGTGTGRVLLWACAVAENWSAFAPDFRELEENEEYAEREDEFDAHPATVPPLAAAFDGPTHGPVDAFTLPACDDAFSLHHLPVSVLDARVGPPCSAPLDGPLGKKPRR